MTEVFYRFRALRDADQPADDGTLDMVASTADPVDFGGYREELLHDNGCVDMSAARALLLNHDADQIIGTLRDCAVDGKALTNQARLLPDARLSTGPTVRDAVKSGALRGVSIGYTYSRDDAAYDEETRTITVRKWRLLEVSLTPIPRDAAAGVRSLPSWISKPAAPAAHSPEARMSDPIKPTPQGTPAAASPTITAPAGDETARARELADARTRAERAELNLKLRTLADEHGVEIKGMDLGTFATEADGLRALLARKGTDEATNVEQPAIRLTSDARDKAQRAAVDSLVAAHFADEKVDHAERGFSVLDIARRFAQRMGLNVSDWNRFDVAQFILGKQVPGARSANASLGMFNTVVLGNFMDKSVMNGFNNFAKNMTWSKWTRKKSVNDFKQFGIGALDTGNLVSTAEGLALPELNKVEGSYTGTLGLFGATVSLTFQALVSDDLGEFASMLARAGAIAQRTIEIEVYNALNNGTFTNNTTSGIAGLATAGDLDELRAAFDLKTGPGGQVLGNTPKYLLVPSCLRTKALQLTTQVQAFPTATNINTDLESVVTPFLTQAGTPSQSTVYLTGDPALVDTVIAAFLTGMETPQLAEYDAGAVAARKWKILQAFVAVLASTTVGGTVFIPGIQQGTN
jgi:HK97 family phage prohead protease